MPVRILVLSDTHLGVDLPARPRSERPRHGERFFASFEQAIAPAFAGELDLVVHLGDLFYRSRISARLATRVFARLGDLADTGVDLFWVPGNHERSAVPRSLLLTHPRIRVFDRPRTFVVERDGLALALAGFPFSPAVRLELPALLAATGYRDVRAGARLLCLHQAVEGATVGPRGFVFRDGAEVVRCQDLREHAAGFAAVLCGHVHRAQVLTRDLAGRRLPMPVIYPGSTERTSSAERDESKTCVELEIAGAAPASGDGLATVTWSFRELAARPMVALDVDPRIGGPALADHLRRSFAALTPQSVVRIRLTAAPVGDAAAVLRAASLRSLAPEGMEVTVAWGRWVRPSRSGA